MRLDAGLQYCTARDFSFVAGFVYPRGTPGRPTLAHSPWHSCTAMLLVRSYAAVPQVRVDACE